MTERTELPSAAPRERGTVRGTVEAAFSAADVATTGEAALRPLRHAPRDTSPATRVGRETLA